MLLHVSLSFNPKSKRLVVPTTATIADVFALAEPLFNSAFPIEAFVLVQGGIPYRFPMQRLDRLRPPLTDGSAVSIHACGNGRCGQRSVRSLVADACLPQPGPLDPGTGLPTGGLTCPRTFSGFVSFLVPPYDSDEPVLELFGKEDLDYRFDSQSNTAFFDLSLLPSKGYILVIRGSPFGAFNGFALSFCTSDEPEPVAAPQAPAIREDMPSGLLAEILPASVVSSSVDEKSTCVVCLENEQTRMFKPCRHLACCDECAETLLLCPICRTPIEKRTRVYRA